MEFKKQLIIITLAMGLITSNANAKSEEDLLSSQVRERIFGEAFNVSLDRQLNRWQVAMNSLLR